MVTDVAFKILRIIIRRREAKSRKRVSQPRSTSKEAIKIEVTATSSYTNSKTVRPTC